MHVSHNVSIAQLSQDKFVLTASKDEQSKMIREDRIPDVRTVIQSDMGLRYLLRNDILTACDDARAELKYQLTKQTDADSAETVDGQELLDLLLMKRMSMRLCPLLANSVAFIGGHGGALLTL
eukprot:scaffold7729_cov82-Skeletonema_marinoi.AAC.2